MLPYVENVDLSANKDKFQITAEVSGIVRTKVGGFVYVDLSIGRIFCPLALLNILTD